MRRGGDKGGTCGGVEIRVGDVSVCVRAYVCMCVHPLFTHASISMCGGMHTKCTVPVALISKSTLDSFPRRMTYIRSQTFKVLIESYIHD